VDGRWEDYDMLDAGVEVSVVGEGPDYRSLGAEAEEVVRLG
jgi:hypothetical protein